MIYNQCSKLSIHPFRQYKMVNSKTYLNVSFAEKDTAKTLGAKWDPSQKKWYVPANIDIALFVKWHEKPGILQPSSTGSATKSSSARSHGKKPGLGAVTHASDKNFVAYSGDTPPWD